MAILIDANALVDAFERSSVLGWSTEQDEAAHKWVFDTIEQFLNDTQPNTDGDLISRQDAVNAVLEITMYQGRVPVDTVVYRISNIPSAETPTVSEKHQLSEETPTNIPTNTSIDLISRQDAIDAIRKSTEKYAGFMEMEQYTDEDAVDAIKSLPSAPDNRQRGEWVYGIDDETGEEDCYAWTCSVCNKKYPWQPNYCPNCGADMRGGEDE